MQRRSLAVKHQSEEERGHVSVCLCVFMCVCLCEAVLQRSLYRRFTVRFHELLLLPLSPFSPFP